MKKIQYNIHTIGQNLHLVNKRNILIGRKSGKKAKRQKD